MKCSQTLLKSCARQLARMTQNAATHRYRIQSICKSLKESPERLWKLCQDALGKTPSDVMDWARAKAFLEVLKTDPNTKLRQLRRQLGYESESAFNAFAHRVFGCAPQEAKTHLEEAERRLHASYAVIEACLALAKPKPKQKTETENRNGKPKQKTENDFFWKKEKKKVR